jgi:hypothetical protein
MAIDDSRLPLVLPASVARVQDDGRPTKPLIDNEFATRQWYLQNAVDLDQKITTVEGSVDTLSGSVEDITAVVANPDGSLTAQKLSTVSAQGITNSGKITDLTAVVANPDGSITAGRLNTVSTAVSGNTASIATVTSSVNGISVKYGVQGTINGVTGGFIFQGVLKNDGSVSYDMEFQSNVLIYGNLLVTGTVNNLQLANNAVSQMLSTPGTGGSVSQAITLRSTSTVLIQVISEGAVMAGGGGGTNSYQAWSSFPNVTLSRNGTTLKTVDCSFDSAQAGGTTYSRRPTTFFFRDAPGAGTFTYQAVCNDAFTPGTAGGAGAITITLTELSK